MASTQKKDKGKIGGVLVIGGGIAGIQASLDLAESGFKVYFLTDSPSIGGQMPRLDKTFPTNDCSMCILSPKLVEAGRHRNIQLITYAELVNIQGKAGQFTVTIKKNPRFVDPEKCTGCGLCATVNVPDRDELVEYKGELLIKRITVNEIKCVQCGDCSRTCAKENPDNPAMSSIYLEMAQPSAAVEGLPESSAAAELRKVRAMSEEDRLDYWNRQMEKCIKCYGCRNICPVFIEKECRLEDWATPGFLPPAPLYHVARAYHIIPRCVHCGFCEEICPGHLPLRTLVDLIRHEDPDKIFSFVPGLSGEQRARILASFPRTREGSWNVA